MLDRAVLLACPVGVGSRLVASARFVLPGSALAALAALGFRGDNGGEWQAAWRAADFVALRTVEATRAGTGAKSPFPALFEAGRVQAAPQQGPSVLPPLVQAAVSRAVGKDRAQFHARQELQSDAIRFAQPGRGLEAELRPEHGLTVRSASGHQWGLELTRWGCGKDLRSAGPVTEQQLVANEITWVRNGGGLREWYVHGPFGIQQGFTVVSAGESCRREAADELVLELQVRGSVIGEPEQDRRSVLWRDARTQEPVFRYSGLIAYDANHRALPARMELGRDTLELRVALAGAEYPVVVDPFVQEAKLTAAGTAGLALFGASVAIDGDTIVVGAPGVDFDVGAAYVFEKPASGWNTTSTYSAKLTPTFNETFLPEGFGYAVAISGSTIVVGAPLSTVHEALIMKEAIGLAYVYVKPDTGWTDMTETARLRPSDASLIEDFFGYSVAIEGDTIVVGAPSHTPPPGGEALQFNGSTYVFVKPESGWSNMTESAKLEAKGPWLGASVGISGDVVVVGAPFHDLEERANAGAAYVFARPAGGWTGHVPPIAKLTASDGEAGDQLGHSAAIDGDTIVVGALFDDVDGNADQGSVYVFTRPTGGWQDMTETARLTTSDGTAEDWFGLGLAIEHDTIVAGAQQHDVDSALNQGAAYVFLRPSGGWATATEDGKLLASDGQADANFGVSIGLSGGVVVAGALFHDQNGNVDQGSAYVFARELEPSSPTPISSATPTPTRTPTPTATPTLTPSGACPALPRLDCDVPARASLWLRDSLLDRGDRFALRLLRSAPKRKRAELGDPTESATYSVCMWQGTELMAQMRAWDRRKWTPGPRGYRYIDRWALSDGLVLLGLRTGGERSARRTRVIALGVALPEVALPLEPAGAAHGSSGGVREWRLLWPNVYRCSRD